MKQTLDHPWLYLLGVGIANLLVLAVISVAVLEHTSDVNDELRATSANLRAATIASCSRGNDVTAYLIVDAAQNARQPVRRQERAEDLFTIRDCAATADLGRSVALPADRRNLYISQVAQRMGVARWKVSP
jgi:hypothetical protein